MEFGPVPSKDSAGAILAHSVRFSDRSLKKGHLLSREDALLLAQAGIELVTVCRLGDEDIHEDEAADRLARAVSGAGIRCSAAFTGRANLIAETDGILTFDAAAVAELNAVDEGITLAALPAYSRVSARQMLATAKIIPFGVPRNRLEHALSVSPKMQVNPFTAERFGLIQTVLDSVKASVLNKTEEILAARFRDLGADALPPVRCGHSTEDLAITLEQQIAARPDAVTIVGASAIVDRRDVIPAAIEAVGGRVIHFGMPVDPGNLLLLGDINGVPVIGAPGCVRSPKPNGYDWVLERLAAGVPVDGAAIMAMGTGGLLKEISSRPLPRARAVSKDKSNSLAPRIVGILLAAGQSRRMGPRNKLLEHVAGVPMIRRTVEILSRSRVDEILVIVGHEADAIRESLSDFDVRFVENDRFADGISASVKAGVAAVPDSASAALFCLGDMPSVRPETIDKILAAFDANEGRAICVPTQNGKRGNPVLFDRRYFSEIQNLSGDTGAKFLMGQYPDDVAEVAVDDPGVLLDIDTPDMLAALRGSDDGRESDT